MASLSFPPKQEGFVIEQLDHVKMSEDDGGMGKVVRRRSDACSRRIQSHRHVMRRFLDRVIRFSFAVSHAMVLLAALVQVICDTPKRGPCNKGRKASASFTE